MEDSKIFENAPDQIDQFVDEIARHPERADSVKQAIRTALKTGEILRPSTPAPAPIHADDLDEFWDNVPI